MNDDDDAIAEEEESCERTCAFVLRTHLQDVVLMRRRGRVIMRCTVVEYDNGEALL